MKLKQSKKEKTQTNGKNLGSTALLKSLDFNETAKIQKRKKTQTNRKKRPSTEKIYMKKPHKSFFHVTPLRPPKKTPKYGENLHDKTSQEFFSCNSTPATQKNSWKGLVLLSTPYALKSSCFFNKKL